MQFFMMLPTKPSHTKGIGIVIMMGLTMGGTANLAWPAFQLATTDQVAYLLSSRAALRIFGYLSQFVPVVVSRDPAAPIVIIGTNPAGKTKLGTA
jgi:hypothetical protein